MDFRFVSCLLPLCITAFAALSALVSAQSAPDLTPEQILIRAKQTYHAHPLPPFVVYTVHRKERTNGLIDFADSYTLRLWCRTSDNSCLVRHVVNGRVTGPLENLFPRFNAAIDPGPVTADLFEPAQPHKSASAPSQIATGTDAEIATIGSVHVAFESDFRARSARRLSETYELEVEPRRDPDRNRAQSMTVDAQSFELRRIIARDRLYFQGSATSYPETFTIELQMLEGHLVLDRVRGSTGEGYDSSVDYTYTDIVFPSGLPMWYFQPGEYGAKVSEAPNS